MDNHKKNLYSRLWIIHSSIQTDNNFNVVFSEVVQVEFRWVVEVFCWVVNWSWEGKEFLRHYPADVTKLHTLHLLILSTIEIVKVDHTKVYCFAYCVQTVYQPNFVLGLTRWCVLRVYTVKYCYFPLTKTGVWVPRARPMKKFADFVLKWLLKNCYLPFCSIINKNVLFNTLIIVIFSKKCVTRL